VRPILGTDSKSLSAAHSVRSGGNPVGKVSRSADGSHLICNDGYRCTLFVGGLATSLVVCVTPWRCQNWPVCSVPFAAC